MSFWCKIGFHSYVQCGEEEVTDPPLGPYDPRSEGARTYNREMEICAKCGKKREADIVGLSDL